ncbi:MAG: hypothetical protein GY952_19680 [Rhodobacteraceae bacterium]|nr:hypothetical protein [Paracoccaceae bacterium]
MFRNAAPVILVLGLLAGATSGDELASPSQWLSDSIAPGSVIQSGKNPRLSKTRGLATEIISITPLDDVKLDAVGVLPAVVAGLPAQFWGDSPSSTLSRLLRQHNDLALPEIVNLTHRVLLAELDVPIGHSQDGDMLLARLDHLLAAGALDQAEALLKRSGTPNADLFRRWFDVGLLTERAQQACATMLGDPGLTPALQARIFCLARSGDWGAAALTLTTATTLDQINQEDSALLSRFLDPELFDGEPDLPAPTHLTPLVFAMREALAMPRSGKSLPLAFLHGDLRGFSGWRDRLSASERLVRAQAVPAFVLLDVYTEAKPSASGGIWDRVQSIQTLISALEAGDNPAISKAMVAAYAEMAKVNLEFALADLLLPQIEVVPLTEEATTVRFHLSLLHKNAAELAPRFAGESQQDRFLVAVIRGDLANIVAENDLQSAIRDAFLGTPVDTQLLRDAKRGRSGEAILKSFAQLYASGSSDPVAVETVLSVLLQAGLINEARRIAVELVVLDRRAAI